MSLPGVASVQAASPVLPRAAGLDRLRGLAVLLMLVDHVLLLTASGQPVRLSLGRVAMPLFAVLVGSCVGRLRWRHARVAGYGLLLPLGVPWIDSPNILVWLMAGAALVVLLRSCRVPVWLLPAVALTAAANGYWLDGGGGFAPVMVVGLVGLGAVVSVSVLDAWGRLLPRAGLEFVGRHALGWYIGHLAFLQLLLLVLGVHVFRVVV